MSIFNIILGIVLLIISVLATRAYISPSQEKRDEKILKITVVLLITYLICMFSGKYSPGLLTTYVLGFGIIWPSLIAFFINRKAIEEPIGYAAPHWSMLLVAFVLIAIILLPILPSMLTYFEGKPIFDTEDIVAQFTFLFFFLPAIVYFVMLGIKRTVIHKKGIFHDGVLWAWSDFENYKWKSFENKKKEVGLTLSTKSQRLGRKIKLKIDAEQKTALDALLAKEVR